MLIFHVLRGREICRLVLYDLDIFQVPLGVQSLEKLENFFNYPFVPLFDVILNCLISFLQPG